MTETKLVVHTNYPNGTNLKKGDVVILHEALSIERLSKLTDFEADDLLKGKGAGRVLLVYRDQARPTNFTDKAIIAGIGHDYWFVIDESTCDPL
jgi:hypothetical protein